MQQGEILIVGAVIAVLAIAILIWLAVRRRRTEALRAQYGEEYDRTVKVRGGRPAAEADLADREKRVKALTIRPLTPGERDRFASDWNETKALFVDSPVEAVLHADRLSAEIMQQRGYPVADFDRRYEDLTVDHGEIARNYRAAHEICDKQQSGQATTEELRQAIKHYELLIMDLISQVDEDGERDEHPQDRAVEVPVL